MAHTRCGECGHVISTKTRSCPECGAARAPEKVVFPIDWEEPRAKILTVIGVVFVILIVIVLWTC